jgi:choline dehydrogenase-like flavoprotein
MAGNRYYDVIIIGTGAGGGTLASTLAGTGKRVLLLERGTWLPREKENWDVREVFINERYHATEMWYDRHGKPFRPHTNYNVGGNTKVYGSILFRFRERDFLQVQHHDGVSPAWPIAYQDLAPYYSRAEQLYAVHGQRGSDPTEPPSAGPYPWPAMSHEPRIREVNEGLRRQGIQTFPLPVGILLDEEHPQTSTCIRCNSFDGFPCPLNGKADAATMCVIPALQHPNVSLLTEAFVTRLRTDPTGRSVTAVDVEHPTGPMQLSADIVVVACGAVNTAALLLRSADDKHPNGLANSSDQVGRNYMCHNNSAVITVFRKPNPSRFARTIGINDFYWGTEDFPYPMGHLSSGLKSQPEMLATAAPSTKLPGVGLTLDFMATHGIDWWATTEDLPLPDNRVTLMPSGEIRLGYTPTNIESHKRLLGKLKQLAERLDDGMMHFIPHDAYLSQRIPLAGVAHQGGTCRFGTDPATSVLDVNCKAHDLDNLYVVDASVFPSSSSVNPALTIMANALRVGDHLKEQLGATMQRGEPGQEARVVQPAMAG